MPTPATLPDDLLSPIQSTDKPSGIDLRSTADWPAIRDSKPVADNPDQAKWAKENSADINWPRFRERTIEALKAKSKDLQIAMWLTEANTRLNGFAGVRDSLTLIRELILQYWDSGLFPAAANGDSGKRRGQLKWLNDALPDEILGIPVTLRRDTGPDYSYAYYLESRRTGGSITAEQFDLAARSTKQIHFETLYEDCRLAREQLALLQTVVDAKFGESAISFVHTKEALEGCHAFLRNQIAKKSTKEPGSEAPTVGPLNLNHSEESRVSAIDAIISNDSWDKAERLVRDGNVPEGLAEMGRLAATEPNGRVRFQRKLLLADICLSTKRETLAKSILEELAGIIEKHHLEEWEAPQLTGAVWSRLYRCYKSEQPEIADASKASEYFLKLCRLDPWQALACSDGK